MRFQDATKSILPYKMSAVGEMFVYFQCYGTKGILPYKMSAAGEHFVFSASYKGENERRRWKRMVLGCYKEYFISDPLSGDARDLGQA